MRLISSIILSACIFGAAACGEDPPSDTFADNFVACGGDVAIGSAWDFVAARVIAGGDGCPEATAASGTLFLQSTGRYSLNPDIAAWKLRPGSMCGFKIAYGGFYRVEGSKICFGDSSAEGSAIPCEGPPPTPQHGVADFCIISGSELRMRSENMLGLTFLAEMELTRRP